MQSCFAPSLSADQFPQRPHLINIELLRDLHPDSRSVLQYVSVHLASTSAICIQYHREPGPSACFILRTFGSHLIAPPPQRQTSRTHTTLAAEGRRASIPISILSYQSFPFSLSVSLHGRHSPRRPHSSLYAVADGLTFHPPITRLDPDALQEQFGRCRAAVRRRAAGIGSWSAPWAEPAHEAGASKAWMRQYGSRIRRTSGRER